LNNNEQEIIQNGSRANNRLLTGIIAIIIVAVVLAIPWLLRITGVITGETMSILYNPIQLLPQIPMEEGIEAFNDWLLASIGQYTQFIANIVRNLISDVVDALLWIPSFILMLIITALAWLLANRGVAIFTFIGLLLIHNMGYWEGSMDTITLIIASVLISICVGLPVGILSTRSDLVHKIVWPILDFMQTMPAFVYLIPAVFFFRIGTASAMIAVIVFSMPPVVRLTGLGIRQVSQEVVEAASAFGATDWQKLIKVQLPLAKPTIMAGINQCIMLALSMVVIAAMIGAGGLGASVLRGIQRMDIGMGFAAGLAVVIVAIILDRITQSSKTTSEEE